MPCSCQIGNNPNDLLCSLYGKNGITGIGPYESRLFSYGSYLYISGTVKTPIKAFWVKFIIGEQGVIHGCSFRICGVSRIS